MAKYIGLMSGTSMDGVDAVLCDITANKCQTLHAVSISYPANLLSLLHSLCTPTPNELNAMATADRLVAESFAHAVSVLLLETQLSSSDITAVGSHGQTIRHFPQGVELQNDVEQKGFTCQIGDPNTLAVLTNIDVVADFRRKDIALGGQGAPLVPAYHNAIFAHDTQPRVLVNIGGIANISVLAAKQNTIAPLGYDTGPGNTLMDAWVKLHLNKPYDDKGLWANTGVVSDDLLTTLLSDSYFHQTAPKSTGREYFNIAWLTSYLDTLANSQACTLPPQDVQATLLALTATSIADEINKQKMPIGAQVIVCGGGAFNPVLMQRIANLLPSYQVSDSHSINIHPQHVEGAAFAWLAFAHNNNIPGNVPAVTGASREAVLGIFCPAN
ncbi:anhydro-N-acetylmuramic acid kinase [Alteromonas stellipolaris]|uniref:anhydro-N-acetylmuramic acid kinase n=1 Tax=Alteromonas stellipolaris TaxID=233316 RepID=UPI00076FEF18|nr:anhydro-N-acetylmuramic acid kinase [Alteromonas stellipolaris]AMJ95633.1 anhydro-N-acetylmuramic acid kinase [Alteromonas stellipolaris]